MRIAPIVAIGLAALAVALSVQADDPPRLLEVRVYDVSAITIEQPAFGEPGLLWPALGLEAFPRPSDLIDDRDSPPFYSGPSEDGSKRFGSIDDVIELVKARDMMAFEQEGVSIAAMGTLGIRVVAPEPLQQTVASILAEMAHDVLTIVTVDLVALRGDPSAAADVALAEAIGRGSLVPLAGARACGPVGMHAISCVGEDRAFVSDEDVELAKDARIPDPIVDVARAGLRYKVAIEDLAPGRITTRIQAVWASVGEVKRTAMRPSGEPVESVEVEGRRAFGIYTLVPGDWTLIPSSGDVCFAVRATMSVPKPSPPSPGERWLVEPVADGGPVALQRFDVGDLTLPARNHQGVEPYLSPSNYTPPEPPELWEASPAVPADEIEDSLRLILTVPGGTPEDDAIQLRSGWLTVLATDRQAEAVRRLIDAWRHDHVRSTRLRTTIVSLPLTSVPEYWSGLDDGASLLADGGRALLARPGALVIDTTGLRLTLHQRNATIAGREHAYVADYDVEIAEGAVIGRPIVRRAFEGLSFDVQGEPAPGFDAVACTLRVDRSTWNSSRFVSTQNGDIECPTLGIARIRGGTVVPIGSLRLVGATLEHGLVTLTIVGASAE